MLSQVGRAARGAARARAARPAPHSARKGLSTMEHVRQGYPGGAQQEVVVTIRPAAGAHSPLGVSVRGGQHLPSVHNPAEVGIYPAGYQPVAHRRGAAAQEEYAAAFAEELPPPMMAYPARTLTDGERFEWCPSHLGPRGDTYEAIGPLPEGIHLDRATGALSGTAPRGGHAVAVRCGGALTVARFTVRDRTATVAGNRSPDKRLSEDPLSSSMHCPWGVAADATHLYVSLYSSGRVVRMPLAGGGPLEVVAGAEGSEADGVPAAEAALPGPRGIAVDGHYLYVSLSGNKVRRVDLRPGGLVTDVAGCGEAGHSGDGCSAAEAMIDDPRGLAVSDGALYVCCWGSQTVRKVDLSSGTISTVVGEGQLNGPHDVAVSGGTLYVTDHFNHRVQAVDLATGAVTTAAGGGSEDAAGTVKATDAQLHYPKGLAVGPQGVYVTDKHRVLLLSSGGQLSTVAGGRDPGFRGNDEAVLNTPDGAVAAGGAVYVADRRNHLVRSVRSAPEKTPGSVQEQQWEHTDTAAGWAWCSPWLELPQGAAELRLSFARPAAGAVTLGLVSPDTEETMVLGAGGAAELMDNNVLKAVVRRTELPGGRATYSVSAVTLNGAPAAQGTPMELSVPSNVPALIQLGALAEGSQLADVALTAPPVLAECAA
eukprot:TRINITY_DN20925_c0_g1_i1.p1 TRINITY_DN20925_c0_g1~~TRINITY_DN20925_c0_g1_i1.p1  ORF type:complete len:685 (+),score=192.30 TRINITY_DN20925_c0_g1_i1:101-2056(+)